MTAQCSPAMLRDNVVQDNFMICSMPMLRDIFVTAQCSPAMMRDNFVTVIPFSGDAAGHLRDMLSGDAAGQLRYSQTLSPAMLLDISDATCGHWLGRHSPHYEAERVAPRPSFGPPRATTPTGSCRQEQRPRPDRPAG